MFVQVFLHVLCLFCLQLIRDLNGQHFAAGGLLFLWFLPFFDKPWRNADLSLIHSLVSIGLAFRIESGTIFLVIVLAEQDCVIEDGVVIRVANFVREVRQSPISQSSLLL